ncbi:MAG: hypothetical protein IJ351_00005 [Oscillospiraceae bacterium]|nr:hypothetical protein [Oscillospiraceae bacterium]
MGEYPLRQSFELTPQHKALSIRKPSETATAGKSQRERQALSAAVGGTSPGGRGK